MKHHAQRVIDPKGFPIWQSPDGARKVGLLIGTENCGAKGMFTILFWLAPGQKTIHDVHPNSEEICYVVSGKATLLLENETFQVVEGMTIYIPPGAVHQSINTGEKDLCYFCVFSPPLAKPYRHEVENWRKIR